MSIVNSATTVNGTTTLSLQTTGVTAATIDGSQNLSVVKDATIHGLTVGQGLTATGNCVAVGQSTLQANTGANNAAVGYQAGYSNTTGAQQALFGYQAGYSTLTGGRLIAMGYQAGYSSNAYDSVYIGASAGYNTTGGGNTFVGANATTGFGAGYAVTTGNNHTILGGFSGNQNSLDIRTASNYIVLSDGAGNPKGIFDTNGNFFVQTIGVPNSSNGGTMIGNQTTQPALVSSTGSYTGAADRCYFINGNGTVGAISTNGSTTTYATSSDYRLKENVQQMQDALSVVNQLNPVTYNWIADGSEGQGFIAHELQAIIPECVTGEKDAVNAEGNPVYQGIDTSFLVATLTAAIKELSAKNDALEARLSALEAK